MAYSRDLLKMAITDYQGLSRTVKDCQGLRTVMDCYELSWTVMDCHGLSFLDLVGLLDLVDLVKYSLIFTTWVLTYLRTDGLTDIGTC